MSKRSLAELEKSCDGLAVLMRAADLHTADPVTARRVRQALLRVTVEAAPLFRINLDQVLPNWVVLPTELVDAALFRFAGVEGRRAVGATCRRFRQWYFHTYVRRFTIDPDFHTNTPVPMTPFHPATQVRLLIPPVRELSQGWLVSVHRLLAQHAFRRIPVFENNILRVYSARFRPFLHITLEEKIEIDFGSNYLSVVAVAHGVRTLKLTIESLVRHPAPGVFPSFPDLETLQIWLMPRAHIYDSDLVNFHNDLLDLLDQLKPRQLLLTPNLWNKYRETPGKYPLPLTNVSIKKD